MSPRSSEDPQEWVVFGDEPLIGIPFEEEGRVVVRYFCSEEEADRALRGQYRQEALDLMGAWSDLDWDDMEQALDRIRHESPPSPPLPL